MMTTSRPRITIERLRTLVLVGGIVLVLAVGGFLAAGKYARRFLTKDLPKQLGINIESQADGVNYTQTRKGKTLFKIHAARAVRMKDGEKTLLHNVTIDLYGEDGKRSDTITGNEFEYDPENGIAQAKGPVEITLMRPGEKPAVAQLISGADKSSKKPDAAEAAAGANSSSSAAQNPALAAITDNEIHVRTSGLTFNQKTSVATTSERVDFALRQGSGHSIGATYDSTTSLLVLDHAVELHVDGNPVRPGQPSRAPVTVHATHAEFERTSQLCRMTQAVAESASGTAHIANALLHFRDDGSVERLDGSGGVDLVTPAGSHVSAPRGWLDFDAANHPHEGLLEGGAHMEASQPGRQSQGSSPTANLTFDNTGQLRYVHMQEGVKFESRQQAISARGIHSEIHRTWISKTADVTFAPETQASRTASSRTKVASAGQNSKNAPQSPKMEPRSIHGDGSVVVTSETTTGKVVTPSKLAADTVVAELAPGGVLTSLKGSGNASFEQRTLSGVHQSSSSDQLDVRFAPEPQPGGGASEIDSVVQTGNVVLTQDPPANSKPNAAGKSAPQATQSAGIRATADRSDYDGRSQLLHLTGSPRIRDGSLEMTAERIDFDRASGDAQAVGDVRASWSSAAGGATLPGASLLSSGASGPASGNGPVHAIAAEAEMHQATQEVVFRAVGSYASAQPTGTARLWQGANSVAAPLIRLNRQRQTLDAEAAGAASPVVTVLLSRTGNSASGNAPVTRPASTKASTAKPDSPSLIRLHSGSLHYSEGERIAIFESKPLSSVTAETTGGSGVATIVSDQTEVHLFPAGVSGSSAKTPAAPASNAHTSGNSSNSSIDRLTASGHVNVTWPARKGSAEKLVYLSDDGTFTLTGTSSAPPRITDQARGTGDDSVTVEGDGAKTVTETRAKK
jgi:lipopolysaccharide export system protein LptA